MATFGSTGLGPGAGEVATGAVTAGEIGGVDDALVVGGGLVAGVDVLTAGGRTGTDDGVAEGAAGATLVGSEVVTEGGALTRGVPWFGVGGTGTGRADADDNGADAEGEGVGAVAGAVGAGAGGGPAGTTARDSTAGDTLGGSMERSSTPGAGESRMR